MKKILVYTIICSLLFSCKSALDIKPQNIIEDEAIFNAESGVEAYMASLYAGLPMEDFTLLAPTHVTVGDHLAHLTMEALNTPGYDASNIGNGMSLQMWGWYANIRNLNGFIEKLPASSLAEAKKNNWMGEAKFIRAYTYFAFVKRYGGVPLITTVQQFTGNNLDELKVPRNTEKELYDFISKELDEAASLLSETSFRGRVNKQVVYAFKSRAMLYAASISKYGTMDLNNILGIPASDANMYWQQAYDAAKKVIEGGKYGLYTKVADKTQNFQQLFLDEANNPEAIFVRIYTYPLRAHSYDTYNIPYALRGGSGYASSLNPTVEMAEEFEYIDGSPGKLKLTDALGNPIKYSDPKALYANKDPRFAATIIYPFSDWRGSTVEVQAGLIDGSNTITTGNYNQLYNGMRIIGSSGIPGGLQVSSTGYYIRKYMNPAYTSGDLVINRMDQDWIDIRYAEVLLNYAEAAIELDKIPDAKSAVNAVRNRAGIKLLDDAEVTRDRIRHERLVELCYEKHYYWDLRRWRIGEAAMTSTQYSAILPFKVLADNTYIFKTSKVSFAKTFAPRFNYERIDPNEILKNPRMIQNPGY